MKPLWPTSHHLGITQDNYKPLDRARNEVRLLTFLANEQPDSSPIQCRLEQVSLDDQPEYVALSYTWGDNTNPTPTVAVGETGFEATQSLESALRRFRHAKHDIRIWADAICINQTDLLERGQQVQIMQRIYGQARAVWVWLGEEGADSGGAMDLIEELADVQIDCLSRVGGRLREERTTL